MNHGALSAVIPVAAMGLTGCASSERPHSSAAGGFEGHRTILVHGDGSTTDLGKKRWAESTKGLIDAIPLKWVRVSERGRVTMFTPAASPHPDCPPVPANTPLAYAKFNRQGQLIEWKLADEDARPVGVNDR